MHGNHDVNDETELRRWRDEGRAPAGSCPFCASRISMIERDDYFVARCSHRGCGARGPRMRSITRAADLFCMPPPSRAGGMVTDRIDAYADLDTARSEVARLTAEVEAMRGVVEAADQILESPSGDEDWAKMQIALDALRARKVGE